MLRHLCLSLLFLFASTSLAQAPSSKPNTAVSTTVYLFGISQNLTDTIVYMSEICEIPVAQIDKKVFLQHRKAYSEQFRNHVESLRGTGRQTTAVAFAKSRQAAEKALVKTFKKLNEQKVAERKLIVRTIERQDFQFRPVTPITP